jgi:hypothetical protein
MNCEVQSWRSASDEYSYRVDLHGYRFRTEHEGWFELAMISGGRDDTIAFEKRFRQNAPFALQPWFEVIFWKLGKGPERDCWCSGGAAEEMVKGMGRPRLVKA